MSSPAQLTSNSRSRKVLIELIGPLRGVKKRKEISFDWKISGPRGILSYVKTSDGQGIPTSAMRPDATSSSNLKWWTHRELNPELSNANAA